MSMEWVRRNPRVESWTKRWQFVQLTSSPSESKFFSRMEYSVKPLHNGHLGVNFCGHCVEVAIVRAGFKNK